MRIQFFPGPELEAKLNNEATKQGINECFETSPD